MDHVLNFQRRAAVNESEDSNIGSANTQDGSSVSAFLSTFITAGILALIFFLLFVILRKSQRRMYAPRTYIGSVREEYRIDPLPDGMFAWISPLLKISDNTVLAKTGLDGYFFLRFMKIGIVITLVGCIITWPVLFPINATGGGGQNGLDIVSFSNVVNKHRYYAHVLIGWVFFGFVLYMIYRELIYFISMKQAYMMSPLYANRLSARTVLLSSVPQNYCDEHELRRIFEHVARVWINYDPKGLDELVEEREKLSNKLEAAEVKLIKLADKQRRAQLKKGGSAAPAHHEDANLEAEESGSVAARYVARKNRPTMRLKFLIGKKVDTIDYCRQRLSEIIPEIKEKQQAARTGSLEGIKKMNSAFIEFKTQSAAQVAVQMVAHNLPLHMAPRYVGCRPEEVIWSNLCLLWWERLVKYAATWAFVVALVIFWSIPVAVVGTISNINYLTKQLPWLGFINSIPPAILGVITGLLPAVMLAVLMALLPIVLRLMARISGCPTTSSVELKTQNFYFLFQVIQAFLVTTFSSAASAAVQTIIKEPTSVTGLLAKSLPKASNFYIAYFLLQGLAIAFGSLLQIVGLILMKVLGKLLDSTPRKMWKRWTSLSGIGWGTLYPIYTLMVVIALAYSVIAPLVLGFATIGLSLMYFMFKYNFLFVYNADIDTKGMSYPRALYHTLTGVYLAEICTIGLFGIRGAAGPLILMVIFLIFTVLFQVSISSALGPLLEFLPKNLEAEEEALLGQGEASARHIKGEAADYNNDKGEASAHHMKGEAADDNDEKVNSHSGTASPVPTDKPVGRLAKFLHPDQHANYLYCRAKLPRHGPSTDYDEDTSNTAFANPVFSSQPWALWIPSDEAGVSKQEVAHTRAAGIDISDEGARFDAETGKLTWDMDSHPPDWEPSPHY